MPERTCLGCGTKSEKGGLLRFVSVEGALTPDPLGVLKGRGAYTCKMASCIESALKKNAFPRTLKCAVRADKAAILEFIDSLHRKQPGV